VKTSKKIRAKSNYRLAPLEMCRGNVQGFVSVQKGKEKKTGKKNGHNFKTKNTSF